MDRYEVPIDDRLAPLVEAAERGDEVVITREGREVARVARSVVPGPSPVGGSDRDRIRELGELLRAQSPEDMQGAARLVRDMRDETRF